MARPSPQPKADPATVLTKALLKAAALLELPSTALGRVLGVSEASISRLFSGTRQIDPQSKEGELALLLVRVYRSLDALVGTDPAQRKRWMQSENRALNARPIELIQGAEGLVSVVSYLDAMRAPA